MNKHLLHIASIIIAILISLSSCKEDQIKPKIGYEKGVFVVCEGNFQANDGTITYVEDSITISDLFYDVNNRILGDIVQSMTIIGDKGYIVVNNSQKIEVVDIETFENIGTINGLSYPRYVTKLSNDEILVTNGNGYEENFVYVINTSTLEKTDSIPTGIGPDKIVIANNKIFVANLGGWSNDNRLTVINASTFDVEKTITVGDLPADIAIDNNDNLILFCKGLTTYDANWNPTFVGNSKILKINTSTLVASTILELDHQIGSMSSNVLAYNNGKIYFLDDAVYSITETATTPVKIIDGNFYGIDINIETNDIWVTSTSSTNSHKAIQYSSTGTKKNEYVTGFYPNSVIF